MGKTFFSGIFLKVELMRKNISPILFPFVNTQLSHHTSPACSPGGVCVWFFFRVTLLAVNFSWCFSSCKSAVSVQPTSPPTPPVFSHPLLLSVPQIFCFLCYCCKLLHKTPNEMRVIYIYSFISLLCLALL